MTIPEILARLAARATPQDRANLDRFGIGARQFYGVSMKNIQALGEQLGRDHALAEALWKTGWYEARLLAAFVDEPARVNAAQMDRWCRQFDNWAVCDTLCFKLFDQAPPAWAMAEKWCRRAPEFEKRAGFALLASLALHDKAAPDERFLDGLAWIERGAGDERNFVKKGVSWALRATGRRNPALRRAALATAQRLASAPGPAARWIGRDALRDLRKEKPDGPVEG